MERNNTMPKNLRVVLIVGTGCFVTGFIIGLAAPENMPLRYTQLALYFASTTLSSFAVARSFCLRRRAKM